ncbi:MAG: hypothetical protein K0Q59_2820 [Paenibacillus sp.]|nr:hypothetical protein [Paenibacillus sp.]
MTTMLIIGFAMLSLVAVGRLALPVVLRFLRSHRLTAANYAGKTIPVGSGLVLAVLFAAMYTFAELAVVVSGSETAWLPVKRADFAAFLVVFVAGWMDDAIGDRSVKGLSGHWRSFRLTHTPTTGGVKAAAIGLAALWLILHSGHSWAVMPIDWLILVLMANAVNLLDVRPGRAWKSFCLGGLLLACAQPDWRLCIWLLPCAAGAVTLLSRFTA